MTALTLSAKINDAFDSVCDLLYVCTVLFVVCSADTMGGSQTEDGPTIMYGMWNVILSKPFPFF